MDQNTIRKTSVLTGIIYLILAILLIPVSISVLLVAKGLIFAGGVVILITGVSCLIAFIQSIAFRKEIKQIEQQHTQTAADEPGVRVSWLVDKTVWRSFHQTEKTRRIGSLLFESALIIIVGNVILMFSRPVSFNMSFLFTAPIALIYYLLKYRSLLSKLPNRDQSVTIVITHASIAFNQTIYPVNSSRFRVVHAEIKTGKNGDACLVVTYRWPLRKGGFSEEAIRVPVTERAKADAAIRLLLR